MIKSRVQNAPRIPGQKPKYNWSFPALALVIKEEGFGALYSGFAPKVLRLAPGGGVLLLVVEMLESQYLYRICINALIVTNGGYTSRGLAK